MAIGHGHTIASDNAAIGIETEQAPGTAGSQNHRFGAQQMQGTAGHIQCYDARDTVIIHQQVKHEIFVKTGNFPVLQ